MFHIGIRLVSIKTEFNALGVHVRFSECERVDVSLVLQVSQGVVDESVGGFVRTDGIYHVQQGRIRLETPVIFCDLWSRVLGPLWESTLFDVFDAFLSFRMSGGDDCRWDADHTNRVGEHCFFLEVSDELSDGCYSNASVGELRS